MKLKGAYDSGTTYAVGDVVYFERDHNVYHLQKPCKAGTEPVDTHFWGKADPFTTEIVRIAMDAIDIANSDDVLLEDDLTQTTAGKKALDAHQGKVLNEAITAVIALLATPYSAESTYAPGAICSHDGKIYRTAEGVWEAEAWTAAHWTEITLGDAIGTTFAAIPLNINSEAIVLSGTSPNEYIITVNDEGETPELDVTLIEQAAENEEGAET